jgi:hypothetical protein
MQIFALADAGNGQRNVGQSQGAVLEQGPTRPSITHKTSFANFFY